MKKVLMLAVVAVLTVFAGICAEQSYTIKFGADAAGTTTLTNATFMTAVSSGADFIEGVTSVVAVFPEKDAIRLSSQKTNGKFNIKLTEEASVVATRIVVEAWRYDNDRDAEASLMLNSETLVIPSPEPELYTLHIASRPLRQLTNLIIDADHRVYISSITVYYDGEGIEPVLESVAAPEILPFGGTVSTGTKAEITCSTSGASIYYTIDGTEPTSAALLYTEPIELHHDLTLKAFAAREGMKPSEIVSADFTVRNPQATLVSEFNFAVPATLNPSVTAPATSESVNLDGRSFTDGDVAVSFEACDEGNTHVRLYGSYDAGTDLRLYNGDMVVVRTLNPSMSIRNIEVTISGSGADSDAWFVPSVGEWIWDRDCWEPGDDAPVQSVELTSWQQSRITSMKVTLAQTQTSGRGITEIPAGREAVYYNLQGIRVENPSPGFVIELTSEGARKKIVRD